MKPVGFPWGSFFTLLLALLAAKVNQVIHYLDSSKCHIDTQEVFHQSYSQSRSSFLSAASTAGAVIHSSPLDEGKYPDLFIDFAVLKGGSKDLFIHMSGTHGVEGYAGSAIQTKVLRDWNERAHPHDFHSRPNVVLVHAVNPFGMSRYRRVNENNVDLNRNFLTPDFFDKLTKRDTSLYEVLSTFLNPTYVYSFGDAFRLIVDSVSNIYTYKYGNIMKAIVEGQYKYETGLQYGGKELQRSHLILQDFLKNKVSSYLGVSRFDRVRHLVFLCCRSYIM